MLILALGDDQCVRAPPLPVATCTTQRPDGPVA